MAAGCDCGEVAGGCCGVAAGVAGALLSGAAAGIVVGAACGIATAIGGLGHTLPYLIPDFWTATIIAGVIVAIELAAIAWIRWKYMETPFTSAINWKRL